MKYKTSPGWPFLLKLIDILESPNAEGDKKLKELEGIL